MKRGEVWWAHMGPDAGVRLVLLVSRDEAYLTRELVMVAPISTRVRDIPSEVLLRPGDGIPRWCAANLDSLETVPRADLQQYLTMLDDAKMEEVERALHFALELKM
ncbi:MAG: type II toxin-antitoxin system PemK/MazF family toxin [Dehalococcoidia bacterium]|nr:type II toxin-antitoxin system PemK/MazF family toxin [Dehalococcoidia bacterium]